MVAIQISKIQLRRGLLQDIDVGSLDAGEMGFSTDTGRLFIGTDPTQTGPWSTRTIVPFDSVEVLTESSPETFARLFDRMNRTVGPTGTADSLLNRRPFLEADLAANTTNWTDVASFTYDANGTKTLTTTPAILSNTLSLSAQIPYSLLDNKNVVQTGNLMALHNGSTAVDEADLTDDRVSLKQIASTGKPFLVNEVFETGIAFRAMRVGVSTSYSFRLQYRNATSTVLRMQFRMMVAAKP